MTQERQPFFYQLPNRAAFVANLAARLNEQICEDAADAFKRLDICIPVTDVSLAIYLDQEKSASIRQIADALDYSHQRVASRINQLIKLELVSRETDPDDHRRKVIRLSDKAQKDMPELNQFYQQAALAFEALFKEIGNDLLQSMQTACSALKAHSLVERIQNLPDQNPQQRSYQ